MDGAMMLVTFLIQFEEDAWFGAPVERQKNRRLLPGSEIQKRIQGYYKHD